MLEPLPEPAHVRSFAAAIRQLTVYFVRTAPALVSAEKEFSKQESHAINELGLNGPLKMSDLAVSLRVGRSAITPLVDRLEALGAVRSSRSEQDRRVRKVELTERGRGVFEVEHAAYERVAASMLVPLSVVERVQLINLLERIGNASATE